MKAYVYDSQQLANIAIDEINLVMGIPVNNEAITTTYCEPIFNNGKYIVFANEELIAILGLPIDFQCVEEVKFL